jgi:hypothetical protein
MNLPIPQNRTNSTRSWRVLRGFTALALISIFVTATSVQAGPVTINQVVQTLTSTRGPAELKLLTQDPVGGAKAPATGQKTGGPTAAPGSDAPQLDKLLSGMSSAQDPQNVGVEIVEEAEVEGTICDCGDILLPAGGMAKWPFLFLAAVPLVFIHDCKDCDDHITTPTPTPPSNSTPTPAPTPEPASLLLFGSGLVAIGAGLRRRYAKTKE